MARKRTDIHRPGSEEFDPEAYTFNGCYDLDGEWGDGGRMDMVNELVNRGYGFAGSTAGTCGHCGASARYVALLTHSNGRDMMYVGEQCLGNRFDGLSKAQFQELRKAALLDRERRARKQEFLELCDACPALVWATYARNIESGGLVDTNGWAVGVLDDIARKARQYGDLSDRQRDLIVRLVGELEQAAADTACQDPVVAALPVPSGPVTVQGEVVSIKWQDSRFGPGGSLRMLVRHADGWKVWGTVPRGLDVARGDLVEFTAMVEPSADDLEFGFFKFPKKARVLAGV